MSPGFGLVEVLATVAIGALIAVALTGVVKAALDAEQASRNRHALTRDARFAMQRIVRAVSRTERLLLPLAENPVTTYSESVRDPGVLAVTLDPTLDRDGDGFADADNDKDGQIDEDIGRDVNNDGQPGIAGIDDDNDGGVDESNGDDDDEDEDQTGNKDEETMNGLDDDGDGAVDEDLDADLNRDGMAGIAGVDDDGDLSVDESSKEDDDEDEDETGNKDEDWLDSVVYFSSGTDLIERMPNLNPADGLDYTERVIAENVTRFRVERIAQGAGRAVQVDITLDLQSGAAQVSLQTRVRVGAVL